MVEAAVGLAHHIAGAAGDVNGPSTVFRHRRLEETAMTIRSARPGNRVATFRPAISAHLSFGVAERGW
jgi:hypothetical protein